MVAVSETRLPARVKNVAGNSRGSGSSDRDDILSAARKYGARNVRVFGSLVREDYRQESDVDLLVEFEPGRRACDKFCQVFRGQSLNVLALLLIIPLTATLSVVPSPRHCGACHSVARCSLSAAFR